ncbi:glycoside hydrolase family 5 protein [Athelia psychrophila]|uniref:mannan endo-1,4-beta-mannosidase n=1 Tax=Athelia psychrophila TaxID=1759441 RepID=A0A166LLA6_9AGAM|nr:glycoside hydrolase family 5 protein [Fibularhizoctonia sp. CBS 109695]
MRFTCILPFLLGALSIAAQDVHKRDDSFVTTQGGDFYVNGSVFDFIGTNAYWLPTLTEDKDIENTFSSMAAAGIKVVRTWAFNDVTEVPTSGIWFQLIAGGTTRINNGTYGLARLDKVVEVAQAHGIYLIFSLTNNWNPLPGDATVSRRDSITGNTLPRNYLSNDFGGMDTYVREFGTTKSHGEFYTDSSIVNTFNSYITNVVSRYVDCPAVLAWEIGNDPRCISSLPTGNCTPQIVTQWHSTVAQHIKSIDANHIISSGYIDVPQSSANHLLNSYMSTGGVDSEDILGIPEIGYSSFQMFTDQDTYGSGVADPNIPQYNQTLATGVNWINQHAAAAAAYCKPSISTGFSLVTTGNAPNYVPFASAEVAGITGCVSDSQRDGAYGQWFGTALSSKVNGMIQYQWGQTGLTLTPASPSGLRTDLVLLESDATGDSPNDGSTSNGAGQSGLNAIMRTAAQGAD